MKIGIITYHCAHNFGAMLQAYALQTKLQNLGYEVNIIDYRPEFITSGYKLKIGNRNNKIREFIHFILTFKRSKKKFKIFVEFEKQYFNLSKRVYLTNRELELSFLDYDAVICGSDQIWNMKLNGESTAYFLEFVNTNITKKISYAASFGTYGLDEKYYNIISRLLSDFDSISVRELQAVEIMKKLSEKKVQHVLDPVFLLNKKEWEDIAIYDNTIKEPYALIYVMEKNKYINDIAKFISSKLKIKVVCITTSLRRSRGIDKNIAYVGPREFLGLVLNASIVCTNSFHGTCFSIIFEKPFISIAHSSLNSRIESILNVFNLDKHLIKQLFNTEEEFNEIISLDKANIKNVLESQKKKSIKYLIDSLS